MLSQNGALFCPDGESFNIQRICLCRNIQYVSQYNKYVFWEASRNFHIALVDPTQQP